MSLIDVARLRRLGLLSFGGGQAVLPEMEREIVGVQVWVSSADCWTAYALGQLTRGPGMLFVTPLGHRIAGPLVAAVATVSFLLPPSVVMLAALLGGAGRAIGRG